MNIHTNPATLEQSLPAPTTDKALVKVAVMIAPSCFASLSQRLQGTARNSDVTSGSKALTKGYKMRMSMEIHIFLQIALAAVYKYIAPVSGYLFGWNEMNK